MINDSRNLKFLGSGGLIASSKAKIIFYNCTNIFAKIKIQKYAYILVLIHSIKCSFVKFFTLNYIELKVENLNENFS